jgi:transglutaminase-like putative cysteine protease/Flp pilus assembly protein TadD
LRGFALVSSHRSLLTLNSIVLFLFVFCATALPAQDVWNAPAFSSDPEAIRRAAAEIKPAKDMEATIFLSEFNLAFDPAGKLLKKRHLIYRIETTEGIEDWSEVRGNWEPWYQTKPEIKARVITADGAVHTLDSATLNDVPVHENTPDLYSDERAYGGPLPALAAGAIVEEEITSRDTAVFFSGGEVQEFVVARNVPVQKTRFVLSHPESLPVRFELHLLPDAAVNKSVADGLETITIEKNSMEAYTKETPNAPPDVYLYPEIDITTGTTWQRVASEYARKLTEKLRIADVQPLVSRLELGSNPGLDAVRKIVASLHKNVRYTGVEFGQSSLIPQYPGETLKRKYGDCKDKATLLIAMLRAAGIPANLALLSSGPGQDTNPEMPGMGTFDHAIVYVPAAGSNPELWIDATAQYSRVGDLPDMDYGRWALVVDEKTTALKKIPELTSEKNVHIETREFTLADYGPARILERDEQIGPTEADYRDYYGGDPKKVKENSEDYIKGTYLADSLTSLDKTDPADLDKPFVVTFTAKGRRGFTEMDNAIVYIPHGNLFYGMPKYFLTSEKEAKEDRDDPDEDAAKPRTVDWVITPFSTEWRYKINAPAGFKVRALPASKEEQLGTGRFIQKYSSSSDGAVVEASLKFDTGKARLTVEEAKTLRDALVKIRSGDGITIAFDQVGYGLLSAGKIREALAVDRQLAADHPKDALNQVRLASVLLAAGLGDKARAVAKQAALLAPTSAQVFAEQAWILEHDQIGRRFGKGFDYDGAVAAYRKAKQLDPKDKPARANLAILLEYGPDGIRYSQKAHLEEAIQEFKDLEKLDEDYARSYTDYIPYDLWYLGRFKELLDSLSGLPATETRKALILAGTAALDGPDAAIKKSLEISSEEQERTKALVAAGFHLARIRKYPQAADLLAAASGQQSQAQITPFVVALRKTKRREDLKIDDSTPIGVALRFFDISYAADVDLNRMEALWSSRIWKETDFKEAKREFGSIALILQREAERANLTRDALADIALSNAHFSTEGDEALGFKVTMQPIGGPEQDYYITRENGQYKLADFSASGHSQPESIAWEVLARLEKNDLAGARKWLDWAREKIHINQGDDPLSGQPFPHFWTKGQLGDEAAIRTAALVLLPSKELKDEQLKAVIAARDSGKTDATRTDLNLVLAYAYSVQERFADLEGVAQELLKAFPDSPTAVRFAAGAYAGLNKLDEWDKLIQAKLQAHPDELEYIRLFARLATYRGQFSKSRELMKGLIDQGKATANDLNSYAWDDLYTGQPIDQDAIDAAHRASDLTKNENFDILHTLACLYAVSGKTKEARELLLKAMNAANMEEPNSAVWLGLATIAEQYGEVDAARAMYARVEKLKVEVPNSNYNLAQLRLGGMQNASGAKTAGQ